MTSKEKKTRGSKRDEELKVKKETLRDFYAKKGANP
jgi:hypothetical protein